MPIDSDDIVIENVQYKIVGYGSAQSPITGEWSSYITAEPVYSGDSVIVSTKQFIYTGADHNAWFDAFNSGKFLYEQLKLKIGSNGDIPDSIENEFYNQVEE